PCTRAPRSNQAPPLELRVSLCSPAASPARSLLPRRVELALDLGYALLPAPVEGPLLDSLRPQQTRMHEDAQVLARGRRAHAKLVGNVHAAHAVAHEIAVGLWRGGRARAVCAAAHVH